MLLKEYLDTQGLKYVAFAERLGVSYRCLWSIMNGKADVPLSVALRIEDETKKKVTCREINKPLMLKKNNQTKKDTDHHEY